MPYIEAEKRAYLDKLINQVRCDEGELAYLLFGIFRRTTDWHKSFARYATLTGVVLLTLLEFWRRDIVPYERGKMEENGDVR